MSCNVILTDDAQHFIVWGVGRVCGLFVQVWNNLPPDDEKDYLPLVDEDALNGLTAARLLEIAERYGMADVVRATLFGAY